MPRGASRYVWATHSFPGKAELWELDADWSTEITHIYKIHAKKPDSTDEDNMRVVIEILDRGGGIRSYFPCRSFVMNPITLKTS